MKHCLDRWSARVHVFCAGIVGLKGLFPVSLSHDLAITIKIRRAVLERTSYKTFGYRYVQRLDCNIRNEYKSLERCFYVIMASGVN